MTEARKEIIMEREVAKPFLRNRQHRTTQKITGKTWYQYEPALT
jgi:hypothetical protein